MGGVAVLVLVALLAGVVTALSPCVLPVLPAVLAGSAGAGPRRVAGIALGFVGSFVLFTLALTAALDALGVSPGVLRTIAIAALIAFGLTLVIPPLAARFAALAAPVARLGERIPRTRSGLTGGLLVGVALGLVWTPCAGPVFAAVAAAAATGDAGPRTFVVLTAYAVGAVVPLILIALGARRFLRRLTGPRSALVRPALGVLMVAAGVVLVLGADTRLTATLVRDLPGYTGTLQALERTSAVQRELDGLRPRAAATEVPPFLDAARGIPPEPGGDSLGLPDAGPAPEFTGISATFGTDGQPITLASLRGRVVLVDFWTYSCVNCVRTLPFLAALYERYRDDGLTVVGVHSPEFAFEADPGNVERAIDDLGVPYPVVLDPDFATWDAFGTRYWPTTYLIDRQGHVRDMHIGEGDEERTEDYIRRALAVPAGRPAAPAVPSVDGEAPPAHGAEITPETWLGTARGTNDRVTFDGGWTIGREAVQAGADGALEIPFRARHVYLVLDGDGRRRTGRVLVDGRPPETSEAGRDVRGGGRLVVTTPRLYRLLALPERRSGRLRVELAPGTRAYAFTFG